MLALVFAHCGAGAAATPPAWEGSMRVSTYCTVNLVNGNMLTEIPIVSWAGTGPDVGFELYHNSIDALWRTSYSATFQTISPTEKKLITDGGREISFAWNGTTYVAEPGYHLTYQDEPPHSRITDKSGRAMIFDGQGRLMAIEDSAGNQLSITYPTDQMVITDAVGRTLTIDYTSGVPKKVTDPNLDALNPRVWTFSGLSGGVTDISDPMGFNRHFGMSGGRITSIRDKSGATFTFAYDGVRLKQVTDPPTVDQGVQRFIYTAPPNLPVTPRTRYTNRMGSTFDFTYDAALNMTGYADGTGQRFFAYDADHNMTSYINGIGVTWSYTYDARGNLLLSDN